MGVPQARSAMGAPRMLHESAGYDLCEKDLPAAESSVMAAIKRIAAVATSVAVFAGTALAVAPSASATSYNGCDWPRVCFYQTQPDWTIGMPDAAYQDVTTYYQDLSSRAYGADWVYNSRNDDRAMLRFTYGGSTYYKCIPPNGTIQFSSASTVTGIRIDTTAAC